jgi:hypothetical protein
MGMCPPSRYNHISVRRDIELLICLCAKLKVGGFFKSVLPIIYLFLRVLPSPSLLGGYTPVFPAGWIGKDDFWMVFTQCCGNPRPPLNHYNFNVQHVTLAKPTL